MPGMVVFGGPISNDPHDIAARQSLAKKLCKPMVECSDSDFAFILTMRPDIAERLRKLL